jgi:RHS repeat-associated protein
MIDASGTTSYTYDAQGHVTSKVRTFTNSAGQPQTRSVGYGYTNGNLTSIRMPEGNTVLYARDAAGRIASVDLESWWDGSIFPILSDVRYDANGAIRGWTWENGTQTERQYDLDGRIEELRSAGDSRYVHDDAGRITSITALPGNTSPSWSYDYDASDRLTSASRSGLARTYGYDGNGNRTSVGGTQSQTHTIDTASNRLMAVSGSINRSYGFDATGNVTSDGAAGFSYDGAGRRTNYGSYIYNGLGERVSKMLWPGNEIAYFYDESGHPLEACQVQAFSSTCSMWGTQQYIWLDDIPVATLLHTVLYNWEGYVDHHYLEIFNIHTDQLNTPRKLTRANLTDALVWRWQSDPFGVGPAEGNLDVGCCGLELEAYAFDLRLPGQIYDAESALHYNYFRDYDPATGRYVESDPIGLDGGINTYAYVGANPIGSTDPSGLAPPRPTVPGLRPGLPGIGLGPPPTQESVRQFGLRIEDALRKATQAIRELCTDDNDDDSCDKILDRSLLRRAGILGKEHAVKADALGTNKSLSQYDLCGCKDGRIVVKAHGCKGPIVAETGYSWK